jgi:glycosyltransferase involved in cell wall biosynthesis
MRIAFIAPVLRKISTKNAYGGIERIITSLVIGSANAGHTVTLYAPYGTDLSHDNLEVRLTTASDISGQSDKVSEAEEKLFKRIVSDQDQFDIIHTHIEPIIARFDDNNYYNLINKPIVVTFHNQTYIDNNIDYYRLHTELHNLNYVFISHNQAKPLCFLPNQKVVYNGINLEGLTFNSHPNTGQLAFLGRITPEKGILQAIDIAKQSGKKLLIAAAIDHSQQNFYENEIKPQIDNENIIYLGEIDNKQKDTLLNTSEALVFPIQWQEPFGLVIVEAMATGTPVVAANIGSVSEIIENNKNGFIVDDINNIQDYSEKIAHIKTLDREYCRKSVEDRFTDIIMIDNYLKYYNSILS